MRVILDTNILVNALITPGGVGEQIYRAWRSGRFELITCAEQFDEFRRVSRYTRLRPYIRTADAGTMVNQIRRLARVVDKLPRIDFDSDPGDAYLLGLAAASSADYLVTGDRSHLLALQRYSRTRIVSARQMTRILARTR
jgi:uncharacterized protein